MGKEQPVVYAFMRKPAKKLFGILIPSFLMLIAAIFLIGVVPAAQGAVTVNSGQTVYNSGGSQFDHVITTPSHSEGDLIFIAFATDEATAITWPDENWTAVYDNVSMGNGLWGLAYKTAGASEPSNYTLTIDVEERAVAVAWSVSGAHGADPIDDTATPGSGSNAETATCNAATTTQADDIIFRIAANDYVERTHSTITDYTMIDQEALTSGATISVQYIAQASIGSTGTADVTWTTNATWGSGTMAIKPAASSFP
ncbi:MAG: hypothetical protein PVJ54_00940, partial [Desulfobacterales bacterium]